MANTLIIECPGGISWRHRIKYIALGLIGWGLWIAMWYPFLERLFRKIATNILEYTVSAVYGVSVDFPHIKELGLPLVEYGLVILGIGLSILLWSKYHVIRFRGRDRRRPRPVAEAGEIASYFGICEQKLPEWQNSKVVTVHFDARGTITQVQTPS